MFICYEDGKVLCSKCGRGMKMTGQNKWIDLRSVRYCPQCGRKNTQYTETVQEKPVTQNETI